MQLSAVKRENLILAIGATICCYNYTDFCVPPTAMAPKDLCFRRGYFSQLESGTVKAILQINSKKADDIPNVPNAIDYAKTPDARVLIESGNPRFLGYLACLRSAAVKDPEFFRRDKKIQVGNKSIDRPRSGRHCQKTISDGCQERWQDP
jgi:hypothetical protein